MSDENKVEYERVDEKGDDYKRILVKFNPSFWSDYDFEIEFIPLENAFNIGKIFVTEIDSMSSIDLYRWLDRQKCLTRGTDAYDPGTIVPMKVNMEAGEIGVAGWRAGKNIIGPRQIISRVKRVYEGIEGEFSEATGYLYNHFLWSGQLGSLPFANEDFTIELLRDSIENIPYPGFNHEGFRVERSLVVHLLDTHKTEYIRGNICIFLQRMCDLFRAVMKKKKAERKKQ